MLLKDELARYLTYGSQHCSDRSTSQSQISLILTACSVDDYQTCEVNFDTPTDIIDEATERHSCVKSENSFFASKSFFGASQRQTVIL